MSKHNAREAANDKIHPHKLIPEPRWMPDALAARELVYFDLRHSNDRTAKGFAERYFNLVRLQKWSSLDGKSVLARYVAHDPDFKWVKLATVRGSSANRVTREMTVQLAKLTKTCQSRVKQIAKVQVKPDELIASGGK